MIQLPELDRRRLEEANERLFHAYCLEEVDRTPIVERRQDNILGYSVRELAGDPEAKLRQQLADYEAMRGLDTDWVPYIEVFFGTGVFAEAFGSRMIWPQDQWPWTKPFIGDIREVYRLKMPRISETHMLRKILDAVDYFQRVVGDRIPIGTMDTTGPFSTALMIVDPEELMTACLTDPRAVHHLLGMITDLVIAYTEEYLRRVDYLAYPGLNWPSTTKGPIGIGIADDSAAIMLSPAQYEEFAVLYNTRISEAFGGLAIHSCGDYNDKIEVMLNISGLRAVQMHSGPGEVDPAPALTRIQGQCTLWSDVTPLCWQCHFPDVKTLYREYVVPRVRSYRRRGLILQGAGGSTVAEQNANVHWLRDLLGD